MPVRCLSAGMGSGMLRRSAKIRAPLALTLEDGSGTAVRDFEWNAYMPNCHTLRLEPADGWQEDAARLLSGKTELTLHRIEE